MKQISKSVAAAKRIIITSMNSLLLVAEPQQASSGSDLSQKQYPLPKLHGKKAQKKHHLLKNPNSKILRRTLLFLLVLLRVYDRGTRKLIPKSEGRANHLGQGGQLECQSLKDKR